MIYAEIVTRLIIRNQSGHRAEISSWSVVSVQRKCRWHTHTHTHIHTHTQTSTCEQAITMENVLLPWESKPVVEMIERMFVNLETHTDGGDIRPLSQNKNNDNNIKQQQLSHTNDQSLWFYVKGRERWPAQHRKFWTNMYSSFMAPNRLAHVQMQATEYGQIPILKKGWFIGRICIMPYT